MKRRSFKNRTTRFIAGALFFIATTAIVVFAFDAAYARWRSLAAVSLDNLISFTMLERWIVHGDPPTGHTLTPSPYFIDLALQIPIVLSTTDFERFAYALAATFALAIFLSLALAFRAATRASFCSAFLQSALTTAAFYTCWPMLIVAHAYVQNHTSEVFSSFLAFVALARLPLRGRSSLVVYTLLVAMCVASSAFFIATFSLPAAIGCFVLALLGEMSFRRALHIVALTALASFAGVVFDAWLSHSFWPIRADVYWISRRESAAILFDVFLHNPEGRFLLTAISAATLVSAFAIWRRRQLGLRSTTTLALAFLPASALTCATLPVLRCAFDSGYALRYMQLPAVLATAVLVAAAHLAVRLLIGSRWVERLPLLAAPFVVHLRGPLTIDDSRSSTSEMLACVKKQERAFDLHAGLATVITARLVNAGRLAPSWNHEDPVIQLETWKPPSINPRENNLLVLRDIRSRKIDFIATHNLSKENLDFFRANVGAPDRVVTCPVPPDLRFGGSASFDLWIYKNEAAQRRLAELVERDNMRGVFAHLVMEDVFGIKPASNATTLSNGVWHWERPPNDDRPGVISTREMFLPSGRYRATVRVSSDGPVAAVVLRSGEHMSRKEIASGIPEAEWDFDFANRGGATSGNDFRIDIYAGSSATRVDVHSIRIVSLEQTRSDVLGLFR